jgi:hypothetical protein
MTAVRLTVTHECGTRVGTFSDEILTGEPFWCTQCKVAAAGWFPEFTVTAAREDRTITADQAESIVRLISGACQSRGIPPMVLLNMILQLTKSIGAVLGDHDGTPIPWITSVHEAACRLVLADPDTAHQ